MVTLNPDLQFDLYLANNFFDDETCRELIREMRGSPAGAAVTYGQETAGVINENVRRVSRVQPSARTVARVTQRLMEERANAAEHFGVNLSGCEEPQFLRYRPGDFFVAHQDGNTGLVNLSSDQTRRVSVSILLNDQSEAHAFDVYGGGSLVFSDWRNNRRFQFSGKAGTLVAFRSEITHEVTPVTHGERFSIVSWYS